ncbi:DUF4251 domain-containing protein [Christiangramia sp.]|uniref:DUF4251 domain-containing protein n=1 Tax=Christiangramia sp. TaxID=1931228 RepID=UPI00262701F2|nr:DUF4251 domain-containing protein [Christiangramia sp.]
MAMIRSGSYLFIVLLILIFISCGGKKELSQSEANEFEELKSLVEQRKFEIVNDFANPSIGNRINLIGNPNYLRFNKDSVDIFLPFFGTRNFGGSYGREGGIKFTGAPTNLTITEEPSKSRMIIGFKGSQDGEILDFIITLFDNNTSNTSVNSSQRSNISYQGEVSELDEN